MKIVIFAAVLTLVYAQTPLEQSDETLVTGWNKPHSQTFTLKARDLEITASFPVNTSHPFELKGFDKRNQAYKIEITTTPKKDNFFQTRFRFVRGNKEESGDLLSQEGKIAKMKSELADPIEAPVEAETKIFE
ncbi:MAG: hypothetical protein C5B49_13115 [Bdellovibrio sp.]|nr:MAG: hypothetical protein C5B49_13115 [Bdellovibrio sp.]